jgi:hypothetical protein
MLKTVPLLIFLFMLSLPVYSNYYSSNYQIEIRHEALNVPKVYREYSDTKLNLLWDVYFHVDSIMEYEFKWWPQSIYTIWLTKKGDCSDYSTLLSHMLFYNNISSRRIHGWCDGVKHDTLLVKLPDGRIDLGHFECNEWRREGYGYW